MQASIKDNVVFCKMCEAHNYKVIDYKTLVKEGKNHTQVIARCNECGTEFYFFTQITIDSEKHYVFDEETTEIKEKIGMKKMKLILNVDDDFEKGDCKNCSLSNYEDDFGEECCVEFNCEDGKCPLEIIKKEGADNE